MAGYKDFTSAVLSSADVDGYLMQQTIIQCTSSTRPTATHEGMTVYETDTNRYSHYNGGAWTTLADLSWRTYTPTVRFGTNSTYMSSSGAWRVIAGNMIQWEVLFDFSLGNGASGQALKFDLPVVPATEPSNVGQAVGAGRLLGSFRRNVVVVIDPSSPSTALVENGDGTATYTYDTVIWTFAGYNAGKFNGVYRASADY